MDLIPPDDANDRPALIQPAGDSVSQPPSDGRRLVGLDADGTPVTVALRDGAGLPPDGRDLRRTKGRIVTAQLDGAAAEPDPSPEPGVFARKPSTAEMRHLHSGHSLTDTYTNGGIEGFPGDLNQLFIAQFGAEPVWTYNGTHQRMVVPGSPMRIRWDDYPDSEAIAGIGPYDVLMITEAGPPQRPTPDAPNAANETLDYLVRFADNMWQNGAGRREVILWSIWPNTEGWIGFGGPQEAEWAQFGGFRGSLVEYGRVFRFFAEYATWKMQQLHPDLPEDWRIRVFPGHAWWLRVHDDIAAGLVPGIADHRQLFRDDIHPNAVGEYGMAVFVHTMLYQTDTREAPTWRPSAAVIDPALDDYFRRIAWEIATAEESVGMGGTENAEPSWTLATYGDLLGPRPAAPQAAPAAVEPDPAAVPLDGIPADSILGWNAHGYDGPPLTGDMPRIVDGVLRFSGAGATYVPDTPMTGAYACFRIRSSGNLSFLRDLLGLSDFANTYSNSTVLNLNGAQGQIHATHRPTDTWETWVDASSGNQDITDWLTVEMTAFGTTISIAIDGVTTGTRTTSEPFSETSLLVLFATDATDAILDLSGAVIMDREPMEAERMAIRAWVAE